MNIAAELRNRKQALTVSEVAEILHFDEETLRRHVRRGDIPCFKIGGTIRFDPNQLADWLDAMSMVPLARLRYRKVS